jgi:hypothetical protein
MSLALVAGLPAAAWAQRVTAVIESDAPWRYASVHVTRDVVVRESSAVRLGVGATHLRFHSEDADGRWRHRASGLALVALYEREFPNAALELQLAHEWRRLRAAPDSGSSVAWPASGLTVAADYFATLGPHGMFGVSGNADAIWRYAEASVGVFRLVGRSAREGRTAHWLGLDATVQGDADAQARQLGPVFALEPPGGGWILLRAGTGWWSYANGTHARGLYFGVTLQGELARP